MERYGDKADVRAGEVPDPEVGADDVLVRIHAASVNPLDRMIRDGELKAILPYRLPVVLGNDLAGIVVEVGAAVTRFAVGDEVFARPDKDRIGTFAELIAVHQDDVAIKPATLTMAEAASPLVALTSWQALVERANIQPGQRVLVHAGSGGLGTIAIQLAKHLGAHVATTTSTANVDLVKRLGADVVVDYRKQAFETVLHDYDVVLDSLGGETLLKSLNVLKPGGQVISVSGPPDAAFGRELGANPVIRLAMSALRALRAACRVRMDCAQFPQLIAMCIKARTAPESTHGTAEVDQLARECGLAATEFTDALDQLTAAGHISSWSVQSASGDCTGHWQSPASVDAKERLVGDRQTSTVRHTQRRYRKHPRRGAGGVAGSGPPTEGPGPACAARSAGPAIDERAVPTMPASTARVPMCPRSSPVMSTRARTCR
ncbi:NADPH:quinone reductase-like Zn-dependent oxidoreductase [Streptomyces paradoxus]|uniref:NADPH:quinone reductase-like Zn-dependent oxidoreductase n=1 Tax=Streptomyces paradoxus TaxID=66375 RepID=A0A7W9WKZ2_9ACTN|nr:NADPH:quinone reductase-like Zn-dependent oxidoreductase [Streptomyces paradoxus]